MIKVYCPNCHQKIGYRAVPEGKTGKCPRCGSPVPVSNTAEIALRPEGDATVAAEEPQEVTPFAPMTPPPVAPPLLPPPPIAEAEAPRPRFASFLRRVTQRPARAPSPRSVAARHLPAPWTPRPSMWGRTAFVLALPTWSLGLAYVLVNVGTYGGFGALLLSGRNPALAALAGAFSLLSWALSFFALISPVVALFVFRSHLAEYRRQGAEPDGAAVFMLVWWIFLVIAAICIALFVIGIASTSRGDDRPRPPVESHRRD